MLRDLQQLFEHCLLIRRLVLGWHYDRDGFDPSTLNVLIRMSGKLDSVFDVASAYVTDNVHSTVDYAASVCPGVQGEHTFCNAHGVAFARGAVDEHACTALLSQVLCLPVGTHHEAFRVVFAAYREHTVLKGSQRSCHNAFETLGWFVVRETSSAKPGRHRVVEPTLFTPIQRIDCQHLLLSKTEVENLAVL